MATMLVALAFNSIVCRLFYPFASADFHCMRPQGIEYLIQLSTLVSFWRSVPFWQRVEWRDGCGIKIQLVRFGDSGAFPLCSV